MESSGFMNSTVTNTSSLGGVDPVRPFSKYFMHSEISDLSPQMSPNVEVSWKRINECEARSHLCLYVFVRGYTLCLRERV